MLLNSLSLSAFLYFGYLLEYPTNPLSFLGTWHNNEKHTFSAVEPGLFSLISQGVRVLKKIFRETMAESWSRFHVIPLSGGLDSRAILGGLLENVDSTEIQAATFGVPGAWDFEIGRNVARAAGVSCESIDLSSEDWKWDTAELVNTAAQTERPIWVFDAHVNRQIPSRFGAECLYWSGFMAGSVSGSHLPKEDSVTWEQAKSQFVVRYCFSRSLDLTSPSFKAVQCLPDSPFIEPDFLGYDEQLDFEFRSQQWVRHVVLPKGYEYRTPFLHPDWTNFILSVPRCYREGQYLYKEILKAAYPRLFSLPVKNNLGLPLGSPNWRKAIRVRKLRTLAKARRIVPWANWGISPSTNYIDFDRGLRERADLKAVVYENIQDLKRRGLVDWIDMDDIWHRHQHKIGNHADALTLLASLEINLKQTNSYR